MCSCLLMDEYIYIHIYMTSILEETLPCLVPRFHEVRMQFVDVTSLDLLDRVSCDTMGT